MVLKSSFAKQNHTNLVDLCAHAANAAFVIIAAVSAAAVAAAEAHFQYATMRAHTHAHTCTLQMIYALLDTRQLCTAECKNSF